MKGKCKLYDVEEDLRASHIYPKFAINYFKKTGSQYLRQFADPNVRRQDGPKYYLLSERAEQEFSKSENYFSRNILKPYMEAGKKELPYNESLYYFAISFLWRILIIHLESPSEKIKPLLPLLNKVESEWRSFLKDYAFPRNFHNVSLFLTDRVLHHSSPIEGVDYYMSRAMDATLVSNEDNSFVAVYGKFLRFMFWCDISKPFKNSGLTINPVSGRINIPQKMDDNDIQGFLSNRMREVANLPTPSEQQQDKILEEIQKDKDAFLNSDAGKSILNDIYNLDPQNKRKDNE